MTCRATCDLARVLFLALWLLPLWPCRDVQAQTAQSGAPEAFARLVQTPQSGTPELSARSVRSVRSVQSAQPAHADDWTLARCTQEALRRSPRLSEGAARVSGAEAAAGEARAGRWPMLTARGSYGYISETMILPLGEKVFPGLPEIELGTNHSYDAQLAAEALLFTGGALSGRIRAQEAALRATRHELRADTLGLLRDVRSAFFTALGAEAQQGAAEVAEMRLRRHVEELTAAIEIGTASAEVRIQALARLRHAEQRRIGAAADARAARLVLGRWVGRAGSEIRPAGDLSATLLLPDLAGTASAVDAAARPELSALGERVAQSRAQASAARAGYLPTLVARAALHEGRPGIDFIEDEWMSYATAGLVLQWTLWEWGARGKRVEQARAQERAADERRAELTDRFAQALAVAQVHWQAAREQALKASERVELERRRLELVKGRYRDGAAMENERLDAEDDLAAAESELAASRARVRLTEVEILQFVTEYR